MTRPPEEIETVEVVAGTITKPDAMPPRLPHDVISGSRFTYYIPRGIVTYWHIYGLSVQQLDRPQYTQVLKTEVPKVRFVGTGNWDKDWYFGTLTSKALVAFPLTDPDLMFDVHPEALYRIPRAGSFNDYLDLRDALADDLSKGNDPGNQRSMLWGQLRQDRYPYVVCDWRQIKWGPSRKLTYTKEEFLNAQDFDNWHCWLGETLSSYQLAMTHPAVLPTWQNMNAIAFLREYATLKTDLTKLQIGSDMLRSSLQSIRTPDQIRGLLLQKINGWFQSE